MRSRRARRSSRLPEGYHVSQRFLSRRSNPRTVDFGGCFAIAVNPCGDAGRIALTARHLDLVMTPPAVDNHRHEPAHGEEADDEEAEAGEIPVQRADRAPESSRSCSPTPSASMPPTASASATEPSPSAAWIDRNMVRFVEVPTGLPNSRFPLQPLKRPPRAAARHGR